MLMQTFGDTNKEYYGTLWHFLKWPILRSSIVCITVIEGLSQKLYISACQVNFLFPSFALLFSRFIGQDQDKMKYTNMIYTFGLVQ